jgi:hypothetical protein
LNLFDKTFRNVVPHKSFIHPAKEAGKFYPETNIIDTERAASYPLIGFNVIQAVDSILETSKTDSRKNVLAITRGMGGGKTRALVEINKQLLQLPNVFPMAITFNSRWKKVNWELDMSPKKVFVYQLVIRMLSIFYGKPLLVLDNHYLRQTLRENIQLVPDNDTAFMFDILHQTIVHMSRKLQHARENGQTIDTFVLMIDETVKLSSYMKILFKKGLSYNLQDLFSDLRETVLDTSIGGMNGALLLSSLDLGPVFYTASDRAVYPIPIASRLAPEEIVNKWWIMNSFLGQMFANQTDFDHMLLPLAATVADLPRTAECLTQALVTVLQSKTQKDEKISKGRLFGSINDVWQKAKENVKVRYPGENVLAPSHLLPVLFQKSISSDNIHIPVMDHIKNSAFTNQILEFPKEEHEKTDPFSIVPTTSFIFLASKGLKDGILNSRLQAIDKAVVDSVELKMEIDGKAVAVKPLGHLLEQVVHQSFLLKFDCLIRSASDVKQSIFGERGIKVKEVLGIPQFTKVPSASQFMKVLNFTLSNDLVFTLEDVDEYTISFQLSHQLQKQEQEINWIKEVDKIVKSSPHNMVYIFQSAPGDAFDGLVVLRSPSNQNELSLFFYDCKSRQVLGTNMSVENRRTTKKPSKKGKKDDDHNLRQYYKIKNIINNVTSDSTIGDQLSESPVYQAMKQKNYLYFYYTTYQDEPLMGPDNQPIPQGDVVFVDESCVYCREPVTKNLLTFLYDMYRAGGARNVIKYPNN